MLAVLALLSMFGYPCAAEDGATSDASWPDLSQLPLSSDVLHESTRKLSGLLSSFHMRVMRKEEFPGQSSEHAIQESQLADHFAAFKRHQLASRQKPREELLKLDWNFRLISKDGFANNFLRISAGGSSLSTL